MKHSNSNNHQLSINVEGLGFALEEYLTTRRLRSIVQEIAGVCLTAKEIEQRGKSGRFEIPWKNGILVVISSAQLSPNRLLRWDLHCVPNAVYSAA